jgi:hypothetical protein
MGTQKNKYKLLSQIRHLLVKGFLWAFYDIIYYRIIKKSGLTIHSILGRLPTS